MKSNKDKPKGETLVAAGRKLMTVVYAVLRDDREYVFDIEDSCSQEKRRRTGKSEHPVSE